MTIQSTTADLLRSVADEAAARSLVPYSGLVQGCVLLLSDGALVPGSRVESASFSLLIPPIVNAFSTAAALGRTDILAIAAPEAFKREDLAFMTETFAGSFEPVSEGLAVRPDVGDLPVPAEPVSPFVDFDGSDAAAIEAVRRIAQRAVVPESEFPVGCLIVLASGKAVPGVNVEHTDWSRVICAERNALGTMVSYGLTAPARIYLTCTRDTSCTPCGACRQLLAELASEATLCMDRGAGAVECTTPVDLLPGFFAGSSIPGRPRG